MGGRRMLVALNRELRSMPSAVQDSAMAELAREVARDFDAGERAAAGRLSALLDKLRKLATPPAGKSAGPLVVVDDEPDAVDELAAARAARLADAAGVVRTRGADQRRPGGHSAG